MNNCVHDRWFYVTLKIFC